MNHFTENQKLAELSSLGIGGPARFYSIVKTVEEMQAALLRCFKEQIPFLILGKGSNCLFDDRGFNGCVIHNKIDGMEQTKPGYFTAGAGYSFSLLGVQTAREGFSGLEFASGIPASVGGAVFMNAGANGAEVKDVIDSVTFVNHDGHLKHFQKNELSFSYRYSPFQNLSGAIVKATFALKSSSISRKTQLEIIHYRQKTQPYKAKSAGCIFRNPEGSFAGKIIEACGLKDFRIGDAQVSSLHANFLVNIEKATSVQFKELIEHVKAKVKEETGIHLETEVRIIPYDLSS